jgi:hypothetical protein
LVDRDRCQRIERVPAPEGVVAVRRGAIGAASLEHAIAKRKGIVKES